MSITAARTGLLAATALTLSAPIAVAQQPAAETQAAAQLDTIFVIGTRQERYVQTDTSIGRLNQNIMEIPRAVVVVPEQVLLDQQVNELNEALRNVPGVTEGDGLGGTLDDFFIRGFRRNSIYRNGIRLSQATLNKPPVQNIERLEVLLGPASVSYGQIQPGGLVNVVTKKPEFTPRNFIQATIDEYGQRKAAADSTGALSDTVAYRLNGAWEDSDTFRDFFEIERLFLSPSLRFDPSDRTSFTLTYEYFADNRPLDRGFVSLPDGDGGRFIPDNIPRSRRFGEPFEVRDTKVHLVEGTLNHRFSDEWSVSTAALYRHEDEYDIQARPRSVDAEGNLRRSVDGTTDRVVKTTAANIQLTGEHDFGAFRNELAIGLDYRKERAGRFFGLGPTQPGFNIFNPVYGQLSPDFPLGAERQEDEDAWGIYLANQVYAGDFILTVGGRYDETKGETESIVIEKKSEFTPQVGLTYKPSDSFSLFASYSKGFDPVITVDAITGETFDPETGEQYEVGVKSRIFGERALATLSLFSLTKSNIVELNSDGELDTVGEVRSRGVELTVTGQIAPGFNVIGSYAYLDNEVLSDFSPNKGNVSPGVAEHTLRLWGSYEVADGALAGLGAGLGLFYTGDRYVNSDNTFELDGYTLIDGALWYYLPLNRIGVDGSDTQIRFGLNVKNITDERYFPAAGNELRINVGAPRTVIGSIAIDF